MASSLTTADIPLLRATLTIQEALNTLPTGLGLYGAARMAGAQACNEEELWELLPALGCVDDTTAIRAIHASYSDARTATLAERYFRNICTDDYQALADSLYEISVGARKGLAETALAAAITASLGEGPRLRDVAHAVIALHSQRAKPAATRGKLIELVGLRKLLVLSGKVSEEDSWIVIVQEVLTL